MLKPLAGWAAGFTPQTTEMIGGWLAAILTLAVLSFVFGDNVVFRTAEYLFVGVAAGYAASLACTQVLAPRVRLLIESPAQYWYYGVFFVMGLMLLGRATKPLAVLGNLPLGVLFGVGAALALGGALTGSFIPQMRASVVSLVPSDYGGGLLGWAYVLDALLLVIGTIAVFSAFHFGTQAHGRLGGALQRGLKALGGVGRGLLMVTFGALLAGAALSFFAILNSRIMFLMNEWLKLQGPTGL